MEPFIGQIMEVGFNFAPRGWAFCNGQLLPVSQYSALFSLLGTTYGGDGRTTFALPDLRGRCAIGMGHGPGLTDRREGANGGVESEIISSSQMPSHSHVVTVDAKVEVGTSNANTDEQNKAFLTTSSNDFYASAGAAGNNLGGVSATATAGNTGANQPINVMQPFLVVNYIIALEGIYPSRS